MDEQEKRGPRGEERFFYKFSGWSVTYRRYPPRLQSTLGLGCPALQGLTRVAVVSGDVRATVHAFSVFSAGSTCSQSTKFHY